MLAILSAPGSRGDVNPMIAIGRELRGLGFEVVISLAENYAELAQAAGLHAEPVIARERFDELLADPRLWTPIGGPRAIIREVAAEFLRLHDEVIRRHHRPGETVLVSHPLDFASRVFRELEPTTPLVDIHLAPSILRSYDSPPRLSPWWFEASRPQWLVRATYWLADTFGVDPMIRGPLNRLRAEHGLAPVRRILNEWWLSPDRIVAMYPSWFAPATKQFYPRLVHADFPLYDADDRGFAAPENRPIVFTAGTAHFHCQEFFRAAVSTCQELSTPGLLVSTNPDNFPADLPPLVDSTRYVSFSHLLPACRAIVHHGGIGTTSQSFSAGIPQVVRPMAFDQFDNATRVENLGCGRWLKRDSQLTTALAELIDAASIQTACKEIAGRLQGRSGASLAARAILETLTGSP